MTDEEMLKRLDICKEHIRTVVQNLDQVIWHIGDLREALA